jgi:DNA modification methylase
VQGKAKGKARRPRDYSETRGDGSRGSNGRPRGDQETQNPKKDKKQMRSVWAIYPPKKEEKVFEKHPTQKPLSLLERIVLSSTNEKDIVLDPFTGSSTTGIASVKHKRKFIGIDRERKYLELSEKRFNSLFKTNSLL